MTESELIQAIKDGQEHAFRKLVEQYKDMVVNTGFGFLHNREDAEDVAQDVFVEAFRSIVSFRAESKLSTWLYRITINKSLNQAKKNKRKQWIRSLQSLIGEQKEVEQFIAESATNPHADIEQSERAEILHRALQSLAENQRIAFTLAKYEGLSYQEIANVMGTTIPAVESLMNRAKKNLQKKLYRYFKDHD